MSDITQHGMCWIKELILGTNHIYNHPSQLTDDTEAVPWSNTEQCCYKPHLPVFQDRLHILFYFWQSEGSQQETCSSVAITMFIIQQGTMLNNITHIYRLCKLYIANVSRKQWLTRYSRQPLRCYITPTHPFNGPFSGTTRVSRYQKSKTNLDFTEATDSEWQWHQLGRMQVCISLQTDNHASTPPLSFLQAGCPSCRQPTASKHWGYIHTINARNGLINFENFSGLRLSTPEKHRLKIIAFPRLSRICSNRALLQKTTV